MLNYRGLLSELPDLLSVLLAAQWGRRDFCAYCYNKQTICVWLEALPCQVTMETKDMLKRVIFSANFKKTDV